MIFVFTFTSSLTNSILHNRFLDFCRFFLVYKYYGVFILSKKNLCIIFGGQSAEHDVSCASAFNIITNLNPDRYNVYPVGITRSGEWFSFSGQIDKIKDGSWTEDESLRRAFISPDSGISGLVVIDESSWQYVVLNLDVVFIALHGTNGEDGTIQGLLELADIPYTGSGCSGSAVCMDKHLCHSLLAAAGIGQARHFTFRKNERGYVHDVICREFKFPVFVKPSRGGSSIGISKVSDADSLMDAVDTAFKFDNNVVIEEGINAREFECAVIGLEEPIVSGVGEIIHHREFYDNAAKYEDSESQFSCPAKIPDDLREAIRMMAARAFIELGLSGYCRMDFLVNEQERFIVLNEPNTLPGFTDISGFPILWGEQGFTTTAILDKIIDYAVQVHEKKIRSFS